jgi:peptidyl-prolyl cis-trans isomerase C
MPTLFEATNPNAALHTVQNMKVSVNGVAIATRDISREMQHHEASTPLDAWNEAVHSLALRELMLQEARRLGLTAHPQSDDHGRCETEEEALVRQLVDQEVSTPEADKATCRRYYEQNQARFRSQDIYEAAHILVAAEPEAEDPLASARAIASQLVATLEFHPGRFEELARAYSACPSSHAGGNLGQITEGDTTPEFEAALKRLSPGELTTEPVITPYGAHIIRLDRKIDGAIVPFDAVQARIAEYLTERSRRQAIAQYLARLAAGAELVGVTMPTPEDVGVF